jgi:hypothetical protein
VGKINWTVVAISAGVTLGASVAVLSTSDAAPEARGGGGGIIVPQSAPVEDTVRPPVRIAQPVQPAPPPVVSVVAVNPAGYTVAPPPPAPVVTPPRPAKAPVIKVDASVPLTPGRLVRTVTNSPSRFASQVIGMSSGPWGGWFGQPVTTSMTSPSWTTPSASSLTTSAKVSGIPTGVGRHRAVNRGCNGGRHHRY